MNTDINIEPEKAELNQKPSDEVRCNGCSPSQGWALYRPDGTVIRVWGHGSMSRQREDNILAIAWGEIRPEDDHRSGTPRPEAEDSARKLGYKVTSVTITPNAQSL